jgi:hypothetical protein
MLLSLIAKGGNVALLVLAVIIAIWWRSHFTYVYFGGNWFLRSWVATIFCSLFAAAFIIGILVWLGTHGFTYLPDLIVLVGVYLFFKSPKKPKDDTGEKS